MSTIARELSASQEVTLASADVERLRTSLISALGTSVVTPSCRQPTLVHAFVMSHPAVQALLQERFPQADSLVHLSQEVRLDEPLRADLSYGVTAEVLGARPDRGGAHVRVGARIENPQTGARVAEVTAAVRLEGVQTQTWGRTGTTTAAARRSEGGEAHSYSAIVDQPFISRYAQVSGDNNPIHLDAGSAADAGFAAPIAHGMSMVGVAVELSVQRYCASDPSRISGFGVRFSAPVTAGSLVTWNLNRTSVPGEISFGARTDQAPALKSGWMTIRESAS